MTNFPELFANISKFVADSRVLLSSEVVVEMGGLDKKVQELCSNILQLPENEQKKHADLLQELFDELTILGDELLKKKELLAHEIRYLSSHKKANVAYKIADAKANPDDISKPD